MLRKFSRLKIRVAGLPMCKADDVRERFGCLVYCVPHAVTRIVIHSKHYRFSARRGSLQARSKLGWYPGLNSVVVDPRRHEHCRVLHSIPNVRVRAHCIKVFKTLLGLGAAELRHIASTVPGGLKTECV